MAVEILQSTLDGGVTPVCNSCGVPLCWDISTEDYAADKTFWDAWICEWCNGGRRMSLKEWRNQHESIG